MIKSYRKGFTKRGGFILHYLVEGEGPPVLVIGSSVFYPKVFSQELRNVFQLVFIDHRGFSTPDNEATETHFGMDEAMADINSIRMELGLEKVIVMGHSAHGYLALEYARRFPENVSHVVVIATGPSHGSHMELAERHWQESVCPQRKIKYEKDMSLLMEDIQKDPENRFIHFCKRMSARSWYDPTFDSSELWKDVKVHMPAIDHLFGKVFVNIDIKSIVSEISQPALMLLGRFDFQVAPHWSWDPYRPLIKDLTLRIFDRSSHYPQFEESELFDKELQRWLSLKTK